MNALRPHVRTLLGLLFLLAATTSGAFLPLGPGNLLLALAIAAAKTFLVVVFFMELRDEKTLICLAACVGLLWLSIFLMLALTDYLTRFPGHLLG